MIAAGASLNDAVRLVAAPLCGGCAKVMGAGWPLSQRLPLRIAVGRNIVNLKEMILIIYQNFR